MIVSHRYKYLFIENPLTASWSIHHELCEYYAGSPVLHKHATLQEYNNYFPENKGKYFTFITIRNPLDVLVSRYLKYKNDAYGVFSDPNTIEKKLTDYSDKIKFDYIKDSNGNFESFFEKFYNRPYSDLVDTLQHEQIDYLVRYESLQDGFGNVLNRLGINQVRLLPFVNKTPGKKSEWNSYYSPKLYSRAKKICGPFMEKWGYEFPEAWGGYQVSWLDNIEYRLTYTFKNFYNINLRYNNHPYARLLRKMRARLFH
jgi:hypothetical protein